MKIKVEHGKKEVKMDGFWDKISLDKNDKDSK